MTLQPDGDLAGLRDLTCTEADLDRLCLELFSVAVRARSLDEMVREVSELLGNPVVLIDGTMRLAAYWPHDADPDDEDWRSVVATGFVSERFAGITQRGQQGPENPAAQAVRHYAETEDELPKYRCTVVSAQGGVVAGLMVLENGAPLTEARRALLPSICQAVANVMDKYGFAGQGRADHLGSLLGAVAAREVEDPAQIEELLDRQGVAVTAPFVAVYWEIPQERAMYAPYWRRLANERIGTCVGRCGDSLLGVVPVRQKEAYRRLVDAARDFGKATGLPCGISAPGTSLAQLANRMGEARDTCTAGSTAHPDRLVHEYAAYACDLLLQQDAVQHYVARHPDPRIALLRDHDAEQGTEYVAALAAYLGNFNNLSRAAQERGLHRNTLGYQIRQIARITGCDLDDPHTAFGLQVALEAERAGHEVTARKQG